MQPYGSGPQAPAPPTAFDLYERCRPVPSAALHTVGFGCMLTRYAVVVSGRR